MPADRPSFPADGRIAVIDLGSNSLRLVIFERHGSALVPLLNEKVMCGLARGLAQSGRLSRDGIALALPNLQRFVALARAIGVDHLAVVATAAVRDAADGRAFAAEVERRCDVAVTIIDGGAEARLSALGLLAGIPEADGVVGDLGGGSVELVQVRRASDPPGPAEDRIGAATTLPIGPLRLAEHDGERAILQAIDRALAGATVLRAAAGRTLYLVGGAWRAIARLHMEQSRYPLHIIHSYTIPRAEADSFLDIIGRQSRRSLERIVTISRKRLEVVPLAALILRELIAAAAPLKVTFSAYGLREGYASSLIPPVERGGDPLIEACIAAARSRSRFHAEAERLQAWTAPLFPRLPEARRRLHAAVCWLSDTAWGDHPDYRAEEAFTRSLRMPFAGIAHRERVFVAETLHARYGGWSDDPVVQPTRLLLDDDALNEARSLGLALRLAYTICGGAVDLLSQAWLGRDGGSLVLDVPAEDDLFSGETIGRRLDALGRALGLPARMRRRAPRRLAGD
jgi:exopolyphosphatase / guanosine-5'-triphosphate,3'-diphosphate pyrophosphatase